MQLSNKGFQRVFHILAIVSLIVCASSSVHANQNLAVVDVQMLLTESKAAKSIQDQIQTKRQQYQQDLQKTEDQLRQQQEEIAQSSSTMSQEELQAKMKAFEQELFEARSKVQQRRRGLEKAANEALQSLRDEILKIVAAEASEKGYDIVVTRQNVIVVAKELDITETILKKLNKALKQIKITIPDSP